MALPPLSAPPADEGMPPPGDEAQGAPMDQPEVFATILRTPDGKFILVDGDEVEPEEMGEGEAPMMDKAGVDGPALLKELMAKIEGGGGAEESFGKAFRGEPDATAMGGPPAGMPPKRMAA